MDTTNTVSPASEAKLEVPAVEVKQVAAKQLEPNTAVEHPVQGEKSVEQTDATIKKLAENPESCEFSFANW